MISESIKECKSFSEAARLLFGINYYNSTIKEKIITTCFEEFELDIEAIIRNNKTHRCLTCGKEIKGRKIFCSSSCAAKYNNKKRGVHSQNTKNKIKFSLIKRYHPELSDSEIKDIVDKNEKISTYENGRKKKYHHICPVCNKEFLGTKKQIYCSPQCAHKSPLLKEKLRKTVQERIDQGNFSGWKSRNIKSYPEHFWETVLDNNNISYVREDFSTKKYFLDFLINANGNLIDLEIDGKQHKYRKEKDIERDSFLKSNGFIVYRIQWNEVNSKNGQEEMQVKIKEFLKFYNSFFN